MQKPGVRKPKAFDDRLKILLYGMTGVGKTYLAATAANNPEVFGKVLLLAVDPGDLTINQKTFNVENIDIDDITSVDKLEKWQDWLETENPKTKEYGTVIIEGATDFAELALLETLERANKADSKRPKYSPDIAHYKEQQIIATKGVRLLRDLPMHVIWTALEFERKDDKIGKTYIRPQVPGQMVNSFGAYFDIIGHLSVGEYKKDTGAPRILRVQSTELIQAKDRSNRLGETIEDPTLPLLVEMMKNNDPGVAPKIDARVNIKKPQIGK